MPVSRHDQPASRSPSTRSANLDRAAGRRELDGVREQVPHDLLQPIGSPATVASAGSSRHRHSDAAWPRPPAGATRSPRSTIAAGRVGRIVSRSLPATMRDMSSRSSMSVRLRPAGALDGVQGPLRVCAASSLPVAQHARPAEHGVQRRAKLVRQRGEELVLQPVGRLGLARLLIRPAQQRCVIVGQ